MKKVIILIIALIAVVSTLIWWISPVSFLKSVNAEYISVINVRDGHTGNSFEIDNKEDITYIVNNIQEQSFRKDGIFMFRMGTYFTLTFCNESGGEISRFIINGDDVIRKDLFFYKTDSDSMKSIIDYLNNLENNL